MPTMKEMMNAHAKREPLWNSKNVPIPLSFRGNEMAGECGEACNIIKKLDREWLGLPGKKSTTTELSHELADVVICATLVAWQCGIPLDEWITRVFNQRSTELGINVFL
jgi:NTP pyrophosphatase (non-canonical NTP hydrolase)